MIGVEVKGVQKTVANLTRMGRDIDAAERRLVSQGSIQARRRLVDHLSARTAGTDPFWGPKSPPAGPWMRSRSGQTRARLTPGGVVVKFGGRYQAAVGSPDAHMGLHEVGGTVVGRPWLTIPTAKALTPGGAPKWESARQADGETFIWPPSSWKGWAGRGRGLWIVRRTPTGLEKLYLLVRSVTMRPRGIFAAVAKEMTGWMDKEARQVTAEVVRKANG